MLCVYCNEREACEDEHVVARLLYHTPKPNDLITVPSCGVCNRGFQKHEEYLRLALTGTLHAVRNSTVAKELYEGPVTRALERRPDLDNAIKKDIKIYPIYDQLTKSVHYLPGYSFDKDRFDIVLKKMVKGLFYHEKGRVLPNSSIITTILDAKPSMFPKELVEIIENEPTKEVGKDSGVFKYVKLEEEENEDNTVWLFVFYNCFYMLLITEADESKHFEVITS